MMSIKDLQKITKSKQPSGKNSAAKPHNDKEVALCQTESLGQQFRPLRIREISVGSGLWGWIVRAFLIEEQKIVVRVLKAQEASKK
ncbi:hypothetical protein BaRGS_00001368 [Batillaria attramentaria]|uniref:Uncharacterized protein n=1 Tax=Batillaria attramentaria TaxID=370345 RepID=A0ABD0M7G6_9CAEN